MPYCRGQGEEKEHLEVIGDVPICDLACDNAEFKGSEDKHGILN